MVSEIQAGPLKVRGISVGGVYTSLYLPELDALLDIGAAARGHAGARRLFLSHTHADHAGALFAHLGIRNLSKIPQALEIFAPERSAEALTRALEAMRALQGKPMNATVHPVAPGDEIPLHGDLHLRVFRTFHRIPSVGYAFLRRTAKLRAEFRELPPNEIAARRRAGDPELFDQREELVCAYATDTLTRVLDETPELYRARTLILECTFLDERKDLETARLSTHVHLDELIERAERFENEALVLMHFSQIYKPREVVEILERRCPPALYERIVPLLPEGTRWPG